MAGSTWTRVAYDHPKLKAVIHEFIDLLVPGDMFTMTDLIDYLATVPMHRYRRPAGMNRDSTIPVGTRPSQPKRNNRSQREWLVTENGRGSYFHLTIMSHPFVFRGAFRSMKDVQETAPGFNAHEVFFCKTDEALNWVCVDCGLDYQLEASEIERMRLSWGGKNPLSFRHIIECSDCFERYRFADENLEDLV